ncbi:MAG TPA: RNA polymerase sigma factor [Gammaproteobacteria bacterium]
MVVKASEIKLINRVAEGEEAAFAQLFQTSSEAVYRYLKRLTGDSDRSDKLLIKTYQQAWQSAGNYNEKLAPISWVLQIARNAVLSHSNSSNGNPVPGSSSAANVIALDRQKIFVKAMSAMPAKSRDSLVLVLMHLYTYHAVSEVMSVTIDEVKKGVFDAKNLLKEKLRQYGIKKHEVSKSNILRELIPLYINGALSGKHKIAFEKSLKNDPSLKQEYMEFYEIEAYFDQLDTVSKQHLDSIYSIVVNSLDDLQEPSDSEADEGHSDSIKMDLLREILSSARIGWGAAALLFALLLIVLVFIGPDNASPVEAKVSTAPILQQPGKVKQLNVIFQDNATNQQIRDLLLALQAELYSGPTNIGLYTITIAGNEQRAQEVLNALRNSSVVVVAEPAY